MHVKHAARRLAVLAASGGLLFEVLAPGGPSTVGAGVATGSATLAGASRRPAAHHTQTQNGARSANSSSGIAIKGYANGFETGTGGWCNFTPPPPTGPCDGTPGGFNYGTVTRIGNGTSQAPYATGINGQAGSWYASVNGTGISTSGCPTFVPWPAGDETCTGPFTTWNNPLGNFTIFAPFHTSLDIYLDTSWADSNPNNEFEWDTALNASNGTFLQDYIFTAQTFSAAAPPAACSTATSAGFVVGYSANTNNNPASGSGSLGSYTPACITSTGWYRFVHRFYKYNASGDLGVEMAILAEPSNAVVADFVTDTGKSVTASCSPAPASCNTAGGPLYGWFPNENIPGLPIDNIKLAKP